MEASVERAEPPLIVIVGPTASGKTATAIELAEQLGGEIICADSRTVYKDMNIGTAKPSKDDQSRVPHWGLDLVNPDQPFTVADFKVYARSKIADIRARGKVPLLVGGSGLYIDAVIFDYQFGDRADIEQRSILENMSLPELYTYCEKNNILLPENYRNKRYVVRAIERNGLDLKRRINPTSNVTIVGIATEKNLLRQLISKRSEQIFADNVVDEAILLGKKYGWEHESMTGNVYPLVHSYLKGEYRLEEVKYLFTTLDWRLAKRQLTWFRRNPYITWLSQDEIVAYIQATLVGR